MRITADTNLLVRAVVQDDPRQTSLATTALSEAQTVVLTTTALCEFAWVTSRAYKLDPPAIARAIRTLLAGDNVEADQLAAEAGLAVLDAGGDFADGVIAFEGGRLGGETFLSFDRRAVRLLTDRGEAAQLLGG